MSLSQRKSFAKERSETSKQQKLFDKMKVERERCCAGRDAVERICKEYLDNELMVGGGGRERKGGLGRVLRA